MRWTQLFENYLISDAGSIKNKKTGRILKPSASPKGYLFLQLPNNGKKSTVIISRLVYSKYVGAIPDGYEINHIDGNKQNNHFTNLEAITHHENILHAVKIGLIKSGTDSKTSKQICEIKQNGQRIFYGSINQAARLIGKSPAMISLCANGKRKSAYGSIWVHVNNLKQ